MNPIIETLKGKKTYFTVAIAALYLLGCYLGFYELDERILAALGITSIAFLRSSIKTTAPCIAAIAALLCLSACTTTSVVTTSSTGVVTTNTVSVLDTNATKLAINAVVPPLVAYASAKDSNARPYFIQASIVLRSLATNGEFDVAKVQSSLAAISIRELQSDEAILAEQTILGLYKTLAAQAVGQQLDKVTWLKPVLLALADAVDSGATASSVTTTITSK